MRRNFWNLRQYKGVTHMSDKYKDDNTNEIMGICELCNELILDIDCKEKDGVLYHFNCKDRE